MKFKSTNHFVNYLFEDAACKKTYIGSVWCPEDEEKGFTDDFIKSRVKTDKENQKYIVQNEETMKALHYSSKEQLEKILGLMKKGLEFRSEDVETYRNLSDEYPGIASMIKYVELRIKARERGAPTEEDVYDPRKLPLVESYFSVNRWQQMAGILKG